eukprot:scaffold21345_cov80-Skeletonema_marinoi.AAC.2
MPFEWWWRRIRVVEREGGEEGKEEEGRWIAGWRLGRYILMMTRIGCGTRKHDEDQEDMEALKKKLMKKGKGNAKAKPPSQARRKNQRNKGHIFERYSSVDMPSASTGPRFLLVYIELTGYSARNTFTVYNSVLIVLYSTYSSISPYCDKMTDVTDPCSLLGASIFSLTC